MRKRHAVTIGVTLVALLLSLAGPAGAHPWGGHQQDECGGEGPVLFVCTTALHFRFADEPVLRHGFNNIGENYTGTVVSRLTYVGGERTFACDYENGSLVADSCGGGGEFPPPQAYFVQTCQSQDVSTETPGGSGAWGCFMEHG